MNTEDWERAGFVVRDGQLERKDGATDIRSARKERGRTNILVDATGQAPKLERNLGDATLVKAHPQKPVSQRFLVRIKSVRKRLLDEDNLCCKYVVDLCRYSGILPSDAPGTTKIEVCQEKADKGAPEEIKIEIYRL